MRFQSTALAPLAALAVLSLCSCSSDPKPYDYPIIALKTIPSAEKPATGAAYKEFKWSDSVASVEAAVKDSRPWTGDPFGVYTRERILNSTLLDIYKADRKALGTNKDESEKETLKNALKLLPKHDAEDFIIRQMAFKSGKSEITLYWFEINDPKRHSRFVDHVIWSKMCMVKVFFDDPPLSFPRVYASQEERYGKPETKNFTDSSLWDWFKKNVDPHVSYHPDKEFSWRKDGLTVALYDWKDPKAETGRSELLIRNDAIFKEFIEKIHARVAEIKKEKAGKDEQSAKQALSN